MKKELYIVHLYASTSFKEGDDWSVKFRKDMQDAFLQLDNVTVVVEGHDVVKHNLDLFYEKLATADYVLVSLNQKSAALSAFRSHIKEITNATDKTQILKFLHSPLQGYIPEEVNSLLGYRFYDVDTLEPVNFQRYWNKLIDVAYDILYRFKSRATMGSVFLAETIEKYDPVRDDVKRELLKRGYDVLPYKSHDLSSISRGFEQDLKKAILSIHIIGSGDAEHLTVDNIADTQNELASQFCLTNPDFKRLVWLHEEKNDLFEDEYLYIEKLKRNRQGLNGAEIVQVPTEKLKNIALDRLAEHTSAVADEGLVFDNSVYLIAEQEDEGLMASVKQELSDIGLRAITIDYQQEQLNVFQNHRDCLAKCDSVLIFHTGDNAKWLKMKLLDLKKAPGYGRKQPFKAKGVFVKKEELLDKTEDLLEGVINFYSGDDFNKSVANKFFDKLRTHA